MNRVPLHTMDSVSDAARPILEHVVNASPGIGRVLNLWGAMAEAPVTLAAYMGIREAIDAHATLEPKIRTAITLTVGGAIGGAYSQAINSRLAQRAGWTAEETRSFRAGRSLEPRLDALLTLVREAATDEGHVQDATWAWAKTAGWSDQELAEAFTFVALVIFIDYFAHFVDLEVDVASEAAAGTAAEGAA